MRIGSLFSGYGGLDIGIQSVLGGAIAWHCDYDKGPGAVLAHHWPDVPNLRDITTVDWTQVEPVDVITGGSPCQDVSAAGKRAGMRAGTRSGLWASMCDGIDIIRPGLVVWENVGGALSAGADSNVEPCPVCLGDTADVHLRALGRVLGDLAEIGYDAWWTTVRAADAGAPHSRLRIFVFAWPAADTDGAAHGWSHLPRSVATEGDRTVGEPGGTVEHLVQDPDVTASGERRVAAPRQAQGGWAWTDAGGRGGAPTADAEGDGRDEGRPEPAGVFRGPDAPIGGGTDPDATVLGRGTPGRDDGVRAEGLVPGHHAWGAYAPAIVRWESVTGRAAPAPTEPGKTGQPRLAPTFVEWLMGLPDGHVTAVPGLTRNEQLKLLGNGVVPQQAALATRMFLAWHAQQAPA